MWPPQWDQCFPKKRKRFQTFYSSLSTTGTLTLDFPSSLPREIKVCCVHHPVYGIVTTAEQIKTSPIAFQVLLQQMSSTESPLCNMNLKHTVYFLFSIFLALKNSDQTTLQDYSNQNKNTNILQRNKIESSDINPCP